MRSIMHSNRKYNWPVLCTLGMENAQSAGRDDMLQARVRPYLFTTSAQRRKDYFI
jgi:hypothetical protein